MTPSRPSRNLRLFVAVYPPPEIAAALLVALENLGDLPAHRPVERDHIHMTLHFVGDTPASRVEAVAETVRRAAGGRQPFELTPQQLITLPRRPPARLVAAETDRPAGLMELQRRLVTRLARNPRQRTGDRFRPHLTLCRFRSPARLRAIERPIAVPSFNVEAIALVHSTLRPEGARHRTVLAVRLT